MQVLCIREMRRQWKETKVLSTSYFSFSPVKNLAELADEPTLYWREQEQGICFVPSANPLLL